jgi:hypothetical protein
VSSSPALSDKHKKGSNSLKKSKKSSTKKKSHGGLAELQDEEKDVLATFLGMPKAEDDDEGAGQTFDALNDSVASLDPSILIKRSESVKPIISIMELYHDEADGGTEGELDLNDDSTQGTQESLSESFRQRHGSTSQLNQAVVLFTTAQLQQSANVLGGDRPIPVGPGHLSPQHSSLSGNSDSLSSRTPRSPSVLKRKSGQLKVESSNTNRRVSWVELPLTCPGTLLVKSTDTDGTNEREMAASADYLSSVDDFSDEKKISDAMRLTKGKANGEKSEKLKKNPSLGAALEQGRGKKKRQSADERTIGTTATSSTNASEVTMKTDNKSKEALLVSKIRSKSQGINAVDERQPPLTRTMSSSSRSSSRSSVRHTSDAPSDGSSSTLSRKNSTDEDKSDKKLNRRPSKAASKAGSSRETKQDSPKESSKERLRRSASEGRLGVPLTPEKRSRKLKRTSSDSKASPSSKAGSKIKYMPKSGSADGQVSGEPTNELSQATDGAGSLSSTPNSLRKKKSYLNRRNQNREHKQQSERAKSFIKSSLDNFLEKMGDAEASPAADARSASSEGRLKNQKKALRARRSYSDDRSVSSAPSMNVRRRSRRVSGKTKGKGEVSSWWNLESKEED